MSEWEPSGAGLYLPGNAVRALRELGIGSALAQRANPIRRQRLLDHRGRLLADIDVDRLWDGVGGCIAIHRAALHEALLEATADVQVRLGLSVTGLEDGEAPRVIFSDGSTGTYDLVVGADGVHSTIRSLALGGPPANNVGQASWRFIADDVAGITDWTVMLGRGRTFLTVSLAEESSTATQTSARAIPLTPHARTGASGLRTSLSRYPVSSIGLPSVLRADRGGRSARLDSGPRRAGR